MPDIAVPIVYVKDILLIINRKMTEIDFDSKTWESEELLTVRTTIRNYYRTLQNYDCAYCKNSLSITSAANAQIEHIVAKSLRSDFMFEPKNLCIICADCNEIKRNQEIRHIVEDPLTNPAAIRYPRSSNAFKIVHPHFDAWDEHILRLGQHYYVDKSRKGAALISTCVLNRRLHKMGWEKEVFSDVDLSEAMNKYLESTDSNHKNLYLTELRKMILFN